VEAALSPIVVAAESELVDDPIEEADDLEADTSIETPPSTLDIVQIGSTVDSSDKDRMVSGDSDDRTPK